MTLKTQKVILAILALILLLTACDVLNPRARLYGKWAIDSNDDLEANDLGTVVFEFTPTGYLIISVTMSVSVQSIIQYDFVDNDTIVFSAEGTLQSLSGQSVDFKIKGDQLTLISNGEVQSFHRMADTQPTP